MKRNLGLLVIMAAAASIAQAAPVTPEKALSEAQQFCQTQMTSKTASSAMRAQQRMSDLKLVHTGDNALYYAFDRADNAGYVLVAGDDCAPAILGYSTSGSFDYDNMPENKKAWLKGYERQIAFATAHNIKYAPAKAATHKAISKMLTCTWNQRAPYNLLCPDSSGVHAATGCVATAMAQVAYYHKWPVTAAGTGSATFQNQALTLDMSSDTFDWDNMLDSYTTSSGTDTQRDAVALLMRDCGYSAKMNYAIKSSGASSLTIPNGLINNLGYDKSAHVELRSWYTDDEWDSIVYNEIANNRPILYTGVTKANEGHEFVCDGYDGNGYYHFNWGWGGTADDWFLLSSLNPTIHGTGGSTYGYAFDYDQEIVAGTQKPVDGSDYVYNMVQRGDLAYDSSKDCFTGGFYNYSVPTISAYIGHAITNVSTGETTNYATISTEDLATCYGYKSLNNRIENLKLADGTYRMSMIYSLDQGATWYDFRTNVDAMKYVYIVVNNGTYTYYNEDKYDFAYSSFTANGDKLLYANDSTSNTVNFTVAANGAEHDASISFMIVDSKNNLEYKNQEPQNVKFSADSSSYEFEFNNVPLGALDANETYSVLVLDNDSVVGTINGYKAVIYPIYTVAEPLKVGNLDNDGTFNLSETGIVLTTKLNNVNNVAFDKYYLIVTDVNNDTTSYTFVSDKEVTTSDNVVSINGEYPTSNLKITKPGTYSIRICANYEDAPFDITPAESATVTFVAKENTTGITDATVAEEVKASVVYNVNGQAVAKYSGKAITGNLPAGVYVVVSTLTDGSVKVSKAVVR